MKVRFYCDIFLNSTGFDGAIPMLFANSKPMSGPGAGTVRVAFDVEIPDRILPAPIMVVAGKAEAVEFGAGVDSLPEPRP